MEWDAKIATERVRRVAETITADVDAVLDRPETVLDQLRIDLRDQAFSKRKQPLLNRR